MPKITIVSPCYNEEDNVAQCHETVKAIFDAHLPGYERAAVWVYEDIADRKRLEREIREREEKFRVLSIQLHKPQGLLSLLR